MERESLILKKTKTSARQEKNDRREKAEDFVTIVAIFDITANTEREEIYILTSLVLQRHHGRQFL